MRRMFLIFLISFFTLLVGFDSGSSWAQDKSNEVVSQTKESEYPEEIRGVWTSNNPKTCKLNLENWHPDHPEFGPILYIKKDVRVFGEAFCNPLNVTGNAAKYQISESCEGEGQDWDESSTYSREGIFLIFNEDRRIQQFQKCEDMK